MASEAQGDKKMEEGQKWEKTTMFRWKMDYFEASKAYAEAASLFKRAKTYGKYAAAQRSLANCYYEQGRLLKAASEIDNAALMVLNLGNDAKEAAGLYELSAEWYLEKGSVDRSSRALLKAAKALEKKEIKEASRLALKALRIYPIVEKGHVQTMDTFSTALGSLLRMQCFNEADELIQLQLQQLSTNPKEYDRYIHKAWLSRVVIAFRQSDMVKASSCLDEAFTKVAGFTDSHFGKASRKLVDALSGSAPEAMDDIVKGPEFKVLDNEVARIARKLNYDPKLSQSEGFLNFKTLSTKIAEITGVEISSGVGGESKHSDGQGGQHSTDDLDLT